MKYLIILLFAFNAYADIRVSVTPINGNTKNPQPQDFKSIEKAQPWIDDMIEDDSWGKKERWEKYTDQTNCLEIVDVTFGGELEYQNCKLPVEYTIVQTDITAEVEAEKSKKILDDARIEELKVKDKDTMKLDELVELLKLRGLI